MPTETFFKLPEEKKKRIVEAAIKEYTRVSAEEASIKNIVENAGIARGSFYQYFESKYDLLNFILKKDFEMIENFIIEDLEKTDGDIFQVHIDLFDFMIKEIFSRGNVKFHEKRLENLKPSDDMFFCCQEIKKPKGDDEEIIPIFEKTEVIERINMDKLNIKDESEMKVLLNMLILSIKKSVISCFKYGSFEKGKEEHIRMIELLKYGALK